MTCVLEGVERGETVLETGRTYDGLAPVRVHVTKRMHRYRVSDGDGAVDAAGVAGERPAFPDRIRLGRCSVNVSRRGEVWLPAVERSGEEWLARLSDLVAEGSLALYQAVLEASEDATR